MPPSRAVPLRDTERRFTLGELFFSTTDRKGIIRSGNEVFVRVSGHAIEDLIGAPHNIIRHPDMPRAVFKLLWDYLGQGKSFAGYVKNLAADGQYYWVMALVVPTTDGYLSIRFKPSSPLLPVVKQLYADMRAIEQRSSAASEGWREGMRAAGERLIEALRAKGFADYDDFMHTALATELGCHRAAATARGTAWKADAGAEADTGSSRTLVSELAMCRTTDRVLGEAFSHVDGLVTLIKDLDAKAAFLLNLSSSVHFVSLNAVIAACRLQRGGEGLSVVAQRLAALSHDSTGTIDTMAGQLRTLTTSLRETAFSITAAKLQVEMTVFFLQELIAAGARDTTIEASRRHDIATLAHSCCQSAQALRDALPRVRQALPGLLRLQADLHGDLRRLSSVHVIGKIQAVGIDEESHFRGLLQEIFSQLQTAIAELDELTQGIASMRTTRLPALERQSSHVRDAVTSFRALVQSTAADAVA